MCNGCSSLLSHGQVALTLQSAADLLMEIVMINVCQGEAIKQNGTSVWVIEALDQIYNGGLATP